MQPDRTPQAHTILVVEDDLTIRETMGEILEDEGYRVLYAEHGMAALAQLHASPPPNLILLDLMMPVMNGWEFRVRQLQDPQLSRIPVVVVSGVPSTELQLNSLQAVDVLSKPIEVPRLLRVVSSCC